MKLSTEEAKMLLKAITDYDIFKDDPEGYEYFTGEREEKEKIRSDIIIKLEYSLLEK